MSAANAMWNLIRESGLDGTFYGDFFGRSREPLVVQAREYVAYWMHQQGFSYPEIARVMRRPWHTSVLAMARRYKARKVAV